MIQNPPRPLRILLVEDHNDTLSALTKLLKIHGHHARGATGCAQAKSLASQEAFDLLVCDIGLPDGSGLDLMRDLKREYRMNGIAVSGYSTEAEIQLSHEAGFITHIVKPIEMDALITAINQLPPDPTTC